MAFLSKYEIDRRKAVEDRVAAQWGVRAPYPSPDAVGAFQDWIVVNQRIRQSAPEDKPRNWARDGARIEKQISDIHARLIAKREQMKVPAPYRSWEHLGAFLERLSRVQSAS